MQCEKTLKILGRRVQPERDNERYKQCDHEGGEQSVLRRAVVAFHPRELARPGSEAMAMPEMQAATSKYGQRPLTPPPARQPPQPKRRPNASAATT